MNKQPCEYCDNEDELFLIEIHHPFFSYQVKICAECVEDLKHENDEYINLGVIK